MHLITIQAKLHLLFANGERGTPATHCNISDFGSSMGSNGSRRNQDTMEQLLLRDRTVGHHNEAPWLLDRWAEAAVHRLC